MSLKKIISAVKMLAFIAGASGLIFSTAAILVQGRAYKENEEITNSAIQIAMSPTTTYLSSPDEQKSPANEKQMEHAGPVDDNSTPEDPNISWLSSLNMEELSSVNSDVIGWILIPGTNISYPLLQTQNNEYYLKHAWNDAKNACGAIFMDYRSSLNNWNSVIYGHNMKNGSMFADLRKYREEQFMEENQIMYILCENIIRQYVAYAAFESDLDDVPYTFGSMSDEAGSQFTDRLKARTGIEIPGPTAVLSTCTGMGHKTRWVVIFSLLSESQI